MATTTPHQSSHQDLHAKGHKYLSHDTPLILMITICHYQIFVYHCQYACHPDTLSLKVVQVGVKKNIEEDQKGTLLVLGQNQRHIRAPSALLENT